MTRHLLSLVLLLATVLGAACAEPCPYDDDPSLDLSAHLCASREHPRSPLIDPPDGEFLLGDPTVLPPAEARDGGWHLFANGLKGVYHFVSNDGLTWSVRGDALFGLLAMRPYIYRDGGTYYLFFEKFSSTSASSIQMVESVDLVTWSTPKTVLSPELAWEKETTQTVGNPFVVRRLGRYWLYYSAGAVWLPDARVYEPRYIGLARADAIEGPYTRETKPIMSPSAGDPLRNLGAGSMKLLDHPMGGRLVALNNGIYQDAAGKSRSAITVIQSDDGLSWRAVCPGAVIAPEPGWKQALVYAFDTVTVGNELWVYFNARDDWYAATVKERIGLATLDLGCTPQ